MTFYERRFTTLPARAPAGAWLAAEELMARGPSSFGREARYWKDRNGQMWAVCIECDAAIKAEHAFWLPSDKVVRDVPACRDCALRAIEQWREDMECVTGEIGVKA